MARTSIRTAPPPPTRPRVQDGGPPTQRDAQAGWLAARVGFMVRSSRRVLAATSFVLALVAGLPVARDAAGAPTPRAPETFRFRGAGNGHGVGMSQYGALHRAEAGHHASEILGFYYPGTSVGPEPEPVGRVRVRVATSVRHARVDPAGRATVWQGANKLATVRQPLVIRLRHGELSVATTTGRAICGGSGAVPCGTRLVIRHPQGEDLAVTAPGLDRVYRWGRLGVVRHGSAPGLQVLVTALSLERYLLGLGEVPASWPDAALEAQAIAGRSFATVTVKRRRDDPNRRVPWDLESGESDQVYLGAAIEQDPFGAPWVHAVATTAGVVVLGTDGHAVTTNYSASNGGYAESSGYVWGSATAWLVAQPDPFDPPSPFDHWERVYTGRELRRWLVARGVSDPGRVESVRVISGRGASGRIDQALVRVRGSRSTVMLRGVELFAAINAGLLSEGDNDRLLLSTLVRIRASSS